MSVNTQLILNKRKRTEGETKTRKRPRQRPRGKLTERLRDQERQRQRQRGQDQDKETGVGRCPGRQDGGAEVRWWGVDRSQGHGTGESRVGKKSRQDKMNDIKKTAAISHSFISQRAPAPGSHHKWQQRPTEAGHTTRHLLLSPGTSSPDLGVQFGPSGPS